MFAIIASLLRDMHKHPAFTLVTATVLTSWIYFSFGYFAVAAGVEAKIEVINADTGVVKTELQSVKLAIERYSLEQKVRSLESDVMTWKFKIENGGATEEQRQWYIRLQTELNEASRMLRRLDV